MAEKLIHIKQSFVVDYKYDLYFTNGLFLRNNPLFKDIVAGYGNRFPIKLLFVLDSGVAGCFADLIRNIELYCKHHNTLLSYTACIVVPGGEEAKKDYESASKVVKAINDHHICRHSFVIAIGGGAVIDMAGYAAATAHRGVKLIRIPTTVLSQNDAAVGVKNGINSLNKKNFLGTFSPPYAIINDSNFLTTLEQRDWIAGIAEGVKVALIKDAPFFHFIEAHATALRGRDMKAMHYLIYRCAELHMQHIAQGGDPFENGSSRPLDFGHWAAHKLEQMTSYELRHGEAVAKGIALDVTYSYLSGLISEEILKKVLIVLKEIGFDLYLPVTTDKQITTLMDGLEEFREHLGGELTITLLSGIGDKQDVHSIDINLMKEAILHLNRQCKPSIS